MREALDPDNGINLALPNDPELLADLCALRWKMQPNGIRIESKDELRSRLGRSTAVPMLLSCSCRVHESSLPIVEYDFWTEDEVMGSLVSKNMVIPLVRP
jgi:hypothetical protein